MQWEKRRVIEWMVTRSSVSSMEKGLVSGCEGNFESDESCTIPMTTCCKELACGAGDSPNGYNLLCESLMEHQPVNTSTLN